MESEAGKAVFRSGRKESWGAILRDRFVRLVVLWPRQGTMGIADVRGLKSRAAGRARLRNSIVTDEVLLRTEIEKCRGGAKMKILIKVSDYLMDLEYRAEGDWPRQLTYRVIIARPYRHLEVEDLKFLPRCLPNTSHYLIT